ncbi:MAG: NBR1-Ig-like domain-containing protein, partial [Chloroflexota bacterium]
MSRSYKLFWALPALLLLVLSACNLNEANTSPEDFYTQAAETMNAAQSETALAAQLTPSATPTLAATPTQQGPTNTPLITNTFTPGGVTNTPIPLQSPQATQGNACDNAQFIDDVTYPDYSEVPAGTTFVKTWRFKNLGPCTWTTDYRIIFSYVSDTGKNGIFTPPAPAYFPETVEPGDEVDLSITLTAPTQA